MIPCKECIESMSLIGDPRIRSGKYRMCSCDYCGKPTYYRELEDEKEVQVVEHIYRTSDMSKKEFDLLQQTALKIDYQEKQIAELRHKKRQSKYS